MAPLIRVAPDSGASGLTPGVFYASLEVTTAVAEMAFWRLLFYLESPDTPWPANAGEYTAFSVRFSAGKGLDLTRPPLNRDAERWTHPTDYSHCQALADAAREADVLAIRYQSARAAGQNVALLACAAFASRAPLERQGWRIHVGTMGVRAICEYPAQRLAFDRLAFARDPRIAVTRVGSLKMDRDDRFSNSELWISGQTTFLYRNVPRTLGPIRQCAGLCPIQQNRKYSVPYSTDRRNPSLFRDLAGRGAALQCIHRRGIALQPARVDALQDAGEPEH